MFFAFMTVVLTDALFSCINMPKKKKSPKRKAETPQSVARRLGITDEEELFGGPSDEEHPEELARFTELQWRNPGEVDERPFIRTLGYLRECRKRTLRVRGSRTPE